MVSFMVEKLTVTVRSRKLEKIVYHFMSLSPRNTQNVLTLGWEEKSYASPQLRAYRLTRNLLPLPGRRLDSLSFIVPTLFLLTCIL